MIRNIARIDKNSLKQIFSVIKLKQSNKINPLKDIESKNEKEYFIAQEKIIKEQLLKKLYKESGNKEVQYEIMQDKKKLENLLFECDIQCSQDLVEELIYWKYGNQL